MKIYVDGKLKYETEPVLWESSDMFFACNDKVYELAVGGTSWQCIWGESYPYRRDESKTPFGQFRILIDGNPWNTGTREVNSRESSVEQCASFIELNKSNKTESLKCFWNDELLATNGL